mmetsp:Transcript_58356/g.140882  ORF Transcript_58356/g.140882 Transcript_58356/m.140882 type:complete len:103 (+) Transcript_58356:140-448(+)
MPSSSEAICSMATVFKGSGLRQLLCQVWQPETTAEEWPWRLLFNFPALSRSQIDPRSACATNGSPPCEETLACSCQYGTGMKAWISACRFTQNQSVGVWQGP